MNFELDTSAVRIGKSPAPEPTPDTTPEASPSLLARLARSKIGRCIGAVSAAVTLSYAAPAEAQTVAPGYEVDVICPGERPGFNYAFFIQNNTGESTDGTWSTPTSATGYFTLSPGRGSTFPIQGPDQEGQVLTISETSPTQQKIASMEIDCEPETTTTVEPPTTTTTAKPTTTTTAKPTTTTSSTTTTSTTTTTLPPAPPIPTTEASTTTIVSGPVVLPSAESSTLPPSSVAREAAEPSEPIRRPARNSNNSARNEVVVKAASRERAANNQKEVNIGSVILISLLAVGAGWGAAHYGRLAWRSRSK